MKGVLVQQTMTTTIPINVLVAIRLFIYGNGVLV